MCGARDHRGVERMTAATAFLLASYMLVLVVLFVGFPGPLLEPFRGGMPEAEWQSVLALAKILLGFAAAYTTFDAFILVYSGTLKGAGDTKWVMKLSMVLSLSLLAGPNLVIGIFADKFANPMHGLYLAWSSCTLFLVVLGVLSAWRFRQGKWKIIDMIEKEQPELITKEILRSDEPLKNPA
jgi:MATE family multidrug resistance protein